MNPTRRKLPALVALCFLLGLIAGPGLAAVTPGGMARTDNGWPQEPSSNGQTGYYNLDAYLTVQSDPGTTSRYFWAHQFKFLNGSNAYMGLQTNGSINGVASGKTAIFSIWDALAAVPGPNASCQTFSGEGSGYSCRLKYSWVEGRKYRLRVYEICCSDKPAQAEWWGAWVLDTVSGVETYIGKIQVPGAWNWLDNASIFFTEYYGSTSACDTIPYQKVRFQDPTANGSVTPSQTASTYGTCKAFAKSWCSGTSCYHESGQGVRNWATVKKGNSGANVYAVQYLLKSRGYSLTVDGVFGSETESRVKSFQTSNGLTSDGIVGPATWEKLVVTVQNGSSGDAVRAVQYLLHYKYNNSGLAVDGIFGSGTTNAVKSFQTGHNLTSDGIVGKNTWSVLIGP